MIKVDTVCKTFCKFKALNDINLEIQKGELVALLGPSGCGKTTLLRIIAGLESPDSGAVYLNGDNMTTTAPKNRGIGFVFQHFALFKHMTVFDNIAFGLQVRPSSTRPSKQEIKERVQSLLKLIQMEWLAESYPGKLSGGQRQRVALARALAVEPSVLLLDEPFSSLDATVRRDLRRWLRRLHDDLHITSVFVTHDQEEALEVADSIVVMNQGEIIQRGNPEEVYDNPVNSFVYNFLGDVNMFRGRLHEGNFLHGEKNSSATIVEEKNEALGLIRPHEVELSLVQDEMHTYAATVCFVRSSGPIVRVELIGEEDKTPIEAEVSKVKFRVMSLQIGSRVYLNLNQIKVFFEQGAGI